MSIATNEIIVRLPCKIKTTHQGVATHSLRTTALDHCVPEDLKEKYFRARLCWLPAEACPQHAESYVQQRTADQAWEKEECCQKYNKFTQRSLGLMKVEYSGRKQILLTSKTYFCLGDKNKQVSKGVCIHQNPLTFNEYRKVLESNQPLSITNRGFRSHQNRIFSYAQSKKGLKSFYPKRIVLDDGIHRKPLEI